MKNILKPALAVLAAIGLSSCTLSEKIDTEINRPPQAGDTVIVHPWNPNPDNPDNPGIGH